jgi:hypothetical protein
MTQEQLRMQMLAGVITESQYKEELEEISPADYKNIPSEIRSELNKMIHRYIETDPNADYSDYKGLIGAIYDFAMNFQQKTTPTDGL